MARFILNRLLLGVLTLLGVSVLVFGLVHIVPGDPVQIMLGDRASADQVEQMREQLGLNDPLIEQYGRFVGDALSGDLGTSIRTGQPVLTELLERAPSTLTLAAFALVIAIAFGVVAGIAAAVARNPLVRVPVQAVILLGMATPSFWIGILLILFFSSTLRWFPVMDDGSLRATVLPAIALALPAGTYLARLIRTGMLEVLGEAYVRTARAKGASGRIVLFRHALRNALLPVVTVLGMQFGALLTGAAVIETVFSRPGIGRYAIQAINARDFPQIQGTVLFVAAIFLLVNLLVDISYGWIDPRVRGQAGLST
ncbi:MAG: ABC transporter permease [Bauldia sp.]|nr:ABC transporter permease [Bauldia sp.]